MNINQTNEGFSQVFPQADDIYKIYELGKAIFSGITDREELKKRADIKIDRQLDYYKNAGKYVGLFDGSMELTDTGYLTFAQSTSITLTLMVFHILSVDIFLEYFKQREKNRVIPYLENRHHLSGSTPNRRFGTLKQWINWCDVIIKENDITVNIEVLFNGHE